MESQDTTFSKEVDFQRNHVFKYKTMIVQKTSNLIIAILNISVYEQDFLNAIQNGKYNL